MTRPNPFATVLACALAAVGVACDRFLPNEPVSEVLAFPTAIRARSYPGVAELLFVLNSNFDLAHGGGSLVTVDLTVAEALGAACTDPAASPHCAGLSHHGYPRIGTQAVINALDAVRVSTFARDLILSADGGNLYAPSGGDDSLTWIEVDPMRAATTRDDGRGVLSCYDVMAMAEPPMSEVLAENRRIVGAAGDLPDSDENRGFVVPECDDQHRPRPSLAEVDPAVLGYDPARLADLPGAPFAAAFALDGRLVHVTHLDSGALSVFAVRADGRPEYLSTYDSVDLATAVAVHPTTGFVYVTGRASSSDGAIPGVRVAVYETAAMADEPAPFLEAEDGTAGISPLLEIVSLLGEAGSDLRGIAFSPDGARGYVAQRSSGGDLLLIADVTGAARGDLSMSALGVVAVGKGAQNIVLLEGLAAGGGRLVLVSCFDEHAIYVVDEALAIVTQIIEVDPGPYGMAPWAPGGAATPTRLFVSSFTTSTISAIDLEPGEGFGRVLYAIGEPQGAP